MLIELPSRSKMDRQLLLSVARLTWILLPIWSGFLISGMSGLRSSDVTLVVPKVILQGETLVMDCRFPSNESAMVYSVKWYKGKREFFRYQPKTHPKTKVIPFSDINLQVDENQSDMNKVVVKAIPAAFRGNISCEVTTEPNYRSVYLTSYLQVAVPPERDPVLTVDVMKKSIYENSSSSGLSTWHQGLRTKSEGQADGNIVNVGDTIVAKCTSGPSIPPVHLEFQINNYSPKLYRGVVIKPELIEDIDNKSSTRVLWMNLTLQHDTFNIVSRKIYIKCLATLFHLYNASSNVVIKELPRENSVAAQYEHNGKDSPRMKSGVELGYMVLLLLLLLGHLC